jgi:adenine deaminase
MQSAGCPCCAYQQPLSAPRFFRLGSVGLEWAKGSSERNVAVDTGSSRTLLLDGGTVVDPRDGSIAANVSIRVRDGRIVEVSQRGTAREDPNTECIDAAGRFIVPGYNDMHSHALNLGNPSGSLALMLAEGVTGFRVHLPC